MSDRAMLGLRHDELRRRNRALAVGAVRRARQASRTDLSAATGLSPSTISAITADLLDEGVLSEAASGEPAPLRRGRPQVAMELNGRACAVVGVTLAYDHLSAAAIDYGGETIGATETPIKTLSCGEGELLATVAAAVREASKLAAKHGPVLRVVIAAQGVVDRAGRTMVWSPITPHRNLSLAEAVERSVGIPTLLENDCNAIAQALQALDPARYGEDFAAVLLSHGIGMGLVLKGELFSGTRSSGAEFGHMIFEPHGALCRCGRLGCVEAYAGDYAIRRFASGGSERAAPPSAFRAEEMGELAAQARAGDRRAQQAFARAGEAVGFGLGSLFALIDPAPLVFVGSGTAAFDLMEGPMRAALAATAGGADTGTFSVNTEQDELPLIRAGCAARALSMVDAAIALPGALASATQSRRVA